MSQRDWKFPRTKLAWRRLKYVVRNSKQGDSFVPTALNPGGKLRRVREDLWEGHALINVGTEAGREAVGAPRWVTWSVIIGTTVFVILL